MIGPSEHPSSAGGLELDELATKLLCTESTEAVGEAVVRAIRDAVAATHISVVVFDQAAEQATIVAAYSPGRAKGAAASRWRLDAFGALQDVPRGHLRFVSDLRSARSLAPAVGPLARDGVRSLLVVPLIHATERIGLLLLGSPDPRPLEIVDTGALMTAADMAAAAMTRAARMERVIRRTIALEHQVEMMERSSLDQRGLMTEVALGQEQERQRIAIDIHDDSVQVMTTAALRMHTLRRRLVEAGHADLDETAGEIEQTIRLAVRRLRHLMFELLPPSLDREGLGAALTLYLNRVRDDNGLGYRVETQLTAQPPAEARASLYRIAQEAVTNVVKHASAASVQVSVHEHDGGYLMRVEDDGVGFSIDDAESQLPLHLGLTAMRRRAEMSGGWCRIRSHAGSGTTVEAWIPGKPSAPTAADADPGAEASSA